MPSVDEQVRQHARFAQQDHPAQRAHRLAHPERNQAQDEQHRLRAAARDLGDVPGRGKRDQQRAHRGEDRHRRRAHERVPVQRLVDERPVLVEAELVDARRDARAQRQHRELEVRQHDEADEPHQRRREQQQQREPGAVLRRRAARGSGGDRLIQGDHGRGSRPRAAGRSRTRRSRRRADRRSARSAAARSGSRCASIPRGRAPPNWRRRTAGSRRARKIAARRAAARRRRARDRSTSGRTNASTASPAAIAPLARARTASPSAVTSSTISPSTRVAFPATRLLAPTKPATNGVRGS